MEELAIINKDSSCWSKYLFVFFILQIYMKQLLWREPCASYGRNKMEIWTGIWPLPLSKHCGQSTGNVRTTWKSTTTSPYNIILPFNYPQYLKFRIVKRNGRGLGKDSENIHRETSIQNWPSIKSRRSLLTEGIAHRKHRYVRSRWQLFLCVVGRWCAEVNESSKRRS